MDAILKYVYIYIILKNSSNKQMHRPYCWFLSLLTFFVVINY